MAGLPWAKANLLIAFAPNDIIKELGPCVGPFSPCISIGLTHTHTHTHACTHRMGTEWRENSKRDRESGKVKVPCVRLE